MTPHAGAPQDGKEPWQRKGFLHCSKMQLEVNRLLAQATINGSWSHGAFGWQRMYSKGAYLTTSPCTGILRDIMRLSWHSGCASQQCDAVADIASRFIALNNEPELRAWVSEHKTSKPYALVSERFATDASSNVYKLLNVERLLSMWQLAPGTVDFDMRESVEGRVSQMSEDELAQVMKLK